MKRLVLFVLFACGFLVQSFAQSFPDRCEGRWKGMMQFWSRGVLVDSVGIIFTVQECAGETGSWSWNTEYLSEKAPMTKNYKLIQNGEKANEFLMDEGDGVILTNYVSGNKMYSLFKVEKYWLTACYELIHDQLIFEVTSGEASKIKSKGVTNYTCDFVQRVVLSRS